MLTIWLLVECTDWHTPLTWGFYEKKKEFVCNSSSIQCIHRSFDVSKWAFQILDFYDIQTKYRMWCDIVNDVVFQFIQSKIWLEQINHIEQCLTIFKWTFFVWSVKRKAVSYKALGTIEIKWLTFEYVSFDCDSRMWTWNVAGHNGSKIIKIKKKYKIQIPTTICVRARIAQRTEYLKVCYFLFRKKQFSREFSLVKW